MSQYLKFRPRKGCYTNSTGNLVFLPVSCEAYSYEWYTLVKRIDGIVYLNTFPFSPTTRRHLRETRRVLEQLGIAYSTIEAPGGLPNRSLPPVRDEKMCTAAIRAHYLGLYGSAIVREKHARNKQPKEAFNAHWADVFGKLSHLGIALTLRSEEKLAALGI